MIFSIRKMTASVKNYFRYFAATPETETWGLGVTAAGHTRVAANTTYPPARHPSDHDFDWQRGRVLDAMQIVLIPDGRGIFETRATGQVEIEPGDAFAVLPGVWHRYAPHPDSGWEESWIEVRGPLVDRLIAASVFDPKDPVRRWAIKSAMEDSLAAVHARSRTGPPGFDAARIGAAFGVVTAWQSAGQEAPENNHVSRAVAEAERFLASHYTEFVNIEPLARRLGVAYSHFRRAFRARTGFAPWQYVLHLRLAHARRLLASGNATLDEIAARLGFSSGFHLSAAFKQAFGKSPDQWRRSLRDASEPRPSSWR